VTYKADFVCYEEVVVELKALEKLSGKEKAQIINYLKATKLQRGLFLNFGQVRLEYERFVLSASVAEDVGQGL
jgi:GxxExxY protein